MRIFSVDGGGTRGIIPATIAMEIERLAKRPLHEIADVFSGSSTGSVLVSGLVAPQPRPQPEPTGNHRVRPKARFTAAQIASRYPRFCKDVFPPGRSMTETLRKAAKELKALGVSAAVPVPLAGAAALLATGLNDSRRLFHPLHDIGSLLTLLGADNMLGDLKLGDALKRTLIASYDLSTDQPVVFDSASEGHRNLRLSRCVAASAAAMSFMPPLEMRAPGGDTMVLTDGGACMNNPALNAVLQLLGEGVPLTEISVVSLGCGHAGVSMDPDMQKWGPAQWFLQQGFIRLFFNADSQFAHNRLQHLLGNRYVRIQVALQADQDEMDNGDPDFIRRLQDMATRHIRENQSDIEDAVTLLRPQWNR